MQSIWSVPHAQGKKVISNTKNATFTTYLKEMFYTKPVASKQPKAPRNFAPRVVPQNNTYRPLFLFMKIVKNKFLVNIRKS